MRLLCGAAGKYLHLDANHCGILALVDEGPVAFSACVGDRLAVAWDCGHSTLRPRAAAGGLQRDLVLSQATLATVETIVDLDSLKEKSE